MSGIKNKTLLILCFSIFFGWVISFPYEGPVMYALVSARGLDGALFNNLSVFALGSGLLFGSYLTSTTLRAKKVILSVVSCTFVISIFVPFIDVSYWNYLFPLMSFVMGIFIPNIVYPIKSFISYRDRWDTAADMLIGGAAVLLLARIITLNVKAGLAYIFIETMLFFGILLMTKLDLSERPAANPKIKDAQKVPLIDFWIFFLFILIITINSGIMFSVIYPYFSNLSLLFSVYTDVPYIISVYLMSRVFKENKFHFLYLGLLLVALSFVLFYYLGQTPMAFILVSSAMLFASGIYDFFWWGTMFENIELVKSPGPFLGIGLSLNVFGVWIGARIGNTYLVGEAKHLVAITGMLLVVICLIIILPLNLKLSRLLVHNRFLLVIGEKAGDKMSAAEKAVNKLLSNREKEVFQLLILGKHDKEICAELNIAKGTIKTHNRNIYKKLRVNSRIELIHKYPF